MKACAPARTDRAEEARLPRGLSSPPPRSALREPRGLGGRQSLGYGKWGQAASNGTPVSYTWRAPPLVPLP